MTHRSREFAIKIAYIVGCGRSGSTILGNVLGQVDGFAHVGEVRQIWRELPQKSATCGCAASIRECPFWREVFDDAFGGLDRLDIDAVRRLMVSSTKLRHLPALYFRGVNARHGALEPFLETIGKFYEAMWHVSGEQMLVDSSKIPSYGYALRMMRGARVYLLHLVRDPRAVAYSWSRGKYQPDRNTYFLKMNPTESSLIWMTWNAAIEAVKARAEGYLRIRYEDFVSEPASELERILSFLGKPSTAPPFVGEREVFLQPQHTIAGNPDRFLVGRVKIRPDEAWKRGLATSGKRTVTALTGPLLLRYGYPITS